jgi:hypothetical protein
MLVFTSFQGQGLEQSLLKVKTKELPKLAIFPYLKVNSFWKEVQK